MYVKYFGAFDAVWCVELTESAFTPDIELAISAKRRRERPSPDLYHSAEGKLFEEGGQGTALRWLPGAELALPVGAESEDFALLSQDDRVLFAAGRLGHLLRHTLHIVWCHLVPSCSEAQLALCTATAHKETPDVVDESRVVAAGADASHSRPIVLVEVDAVRRVGHLLCSSCAALAKIVVSPGEDIAETCHDKRVRLSTGNGLQLVV